MLLVYKGYIRFNVSAAKRYDVWGVDVSEYQGEINWSLLEKQGLDFAFIRATEGSGYRDKYFEENLKNGSETKIIVGAYHFFSFDSPAETQAENFISAIGNYSGKMLPPVVDIELYGKHKNNHPKADAVHGELNKLLDILEEYYGVKPIIYTTQKTYSLYIENLYKDYPLWMRDVYFAPSPEKLGWQFWQYSDKGLLNGYSGSEKYIDMNVFKGSKNELEFMQITISPK